MTNYTMPDEITIYLVDMGEGQLLSFVPPVTGNYEEAVYNLTAHYHLPADKDDQREARKAALQWFNGRVEIFSVKHPQQIPHIDTIMAALQQPDTSREIPGPFICGAGGKEISKNVHEVLSICPAYGSDAVYTYKLQRQKQPDESALELAAKDVLATHPCNPFSSSDRDTQDAAFAKLRAAMKGVDHE